MEGRAHGRSYLNVVLQKLLLSIARFLLRDIDCNGRYILANVLRREEGHRSQGGPSAIGWMACPSFVRVLDYWFPRRLARDALINCLFCEVVNAWEPGFGSE